MLISQQLKYKMTSPCLIYFNLFCLCKHFLTWLPNKWLVVVLYNVQNFDDKLVKTSMVGGSTSVLNILTSFH